MKRVFLLIAIVLVSFVSFAQEGDEIRTLMSPGNAVGAYGALTMDYSQIDDRDALSFGIKGGMILGHMVGIGISGTGFFNDSRFEPSLGGKVSIAGGYGGFFFEPVLMPKMPVHVSFPVMVGAGGMAVVTISEEDNFWEENVHSEASDAFMIIQPGIEVELNITRFFRFALGGYYRYTSNIDIESDFEYYLPQDVLRGFSMGVAFKFGKF